MLHLLFAVFISVGALAIWLDWYWLVLVGFTLPIGVMIGCLFSAMMQYLLVWARKLNLAGIQSGVAGLMFGVWGALFSVIAPLVVARFGLERTLVGSGVLVLAIGLLASKAFFTPYEGEVAATSEALPVLDFRELFSSKTYWVFLVFSTLFLIPGFGFKVIVQALAVSVFHVTQFDASMVAVAFLSTYGLSRLICGFLADRYPLKSMYLIFAGGQSLALLVAAISLPLYPNVVFLTVLMCVVGSPFCRGQKPLGHGDGELVRAA